MRSAKWYFTSTQSISALTAPTDATNVAGIPRVTSVEPLTMLRTVSLGGREPEALLGDNTGRFLVDDSARVADPDRLHGGVELGKQGDYLVNAGLSSR